MSHPRRKPVALIVAAALILGLAAPAAAEAAFGAIAVNPSDGAFGVSYDYPTQHSAKRRAERECPGQCRIAVWVRDQCGAVVATSRRYVAGVGPTKRAAYADAFRRADRGASRLAYVCSG